MKRSDILKLVESERSRQDEIHPGFPQDNGLRLAILTEELGEVAKAIIENKPGEIKDELIQVASVAIRWLEQME